MPFKFRVIYDARIYGRGAREREGGWDPTDRYRLREFSLPRSIFQARRGLSTFNLGRLTPNLLYGAELGRARNRTLVNRQQTGRALYPGDLPVQVH